MTSITDPDQVLGRFKELKDPSWQSISKVKQAVSAAKALRSQGREHGMPMQTKSFLDSNPLQIVKRYYWIEDEKSEDVVLDKRLVGLVWFGPHAQGPPGHAHGGSMASVLDELSGWTGFLLNGVPTLVAELNVKMKKSIPLFQVMYLEAFICRVQGRSAIVKSTIRDKTGEVYAEGEVRAVSVRPKL